MKLFHVICFAVATVLLSGAAAHAEWTGDPGNKYWSSVTINKIASGQIDKYQYFCIEASNSGGSIKACAGNHQTSVWNHAYDLLYKQAMYYYSTGQKVRLYYAEDIWQYKQFVDAYSGNHIVGFATCTSGTECFGPTN